MNSIKLSNRQGEMLDVLISGNADADNLIVFAHGLGSNKHENFNLFDDIANISADQYLIIRFDFSGYGESEGRQEDSCISKTRDDLDSVLEYARTLSKKIFIIAHSMGTFAVSALKPLGVEGIIFTSPPSSDTEASISNTKNRIISRGGTVNEDGITEYRRTNGDVQKLGPKFWSDLRNFRPVIETTALAHYSTLAIFKPADDEVVVGIDDPWYEYSFHGIRYQRLPGDHNFTSKEDRVALFGEIESFFEEEKVVFVAHPISGDVEGNIQKVIAICKEIHSERIIPIFPSLLWRKYLGDSESDKLLASHVNRALFENGAVDEVWFYGEKLSPSMKDEVDLAIEWEVPCIGKTSSVADKIIDRFDESFRAIQD